MDKSDYYYSFKTRLKSRIKTMSRSCVMARIMGREGQFELNRVNIKIKMVIIIILKLTRFGGQPRARPGSLIIRVKYIDKIIIFII